MDEAHHLHWSEERAGDDYLFVEALAARSAGLLLLTATPEQLGRIGHFGRLRLLERVLAAELEGLEAEAAAAAEGAADAGGRGHQAAGRGAAAGLGRCDRRLCRGRRVDRFDDCEAKAEE